MSSAEEETKDPYGAIKFGEFRKYMQNKQSKLKKQQKELGEQASQELEQIFKGLSIYINGYTDPPSSDLRRMILQHGGDYQHYLKKISVTHIIATNLTNLKMQEFRAYKVVKPNWITESIKKSQLLPWQNYRLVPRATTQKELLFNTEEKQEKTEKPTTPTTGEELNANLLSNDWARSVSTVNPEFIKRYYETSRLHYLSTWKGELKEIVEKLEQKYPKSSSSKRSTRRIVMHIDFDCFFASVGIKDRSWLKNKPVAVSHSKGASEASSSDIASCNYVARSYGLRNGMTIGSAKTLCPDLQVVPYEFEKYRAISEIFYEIVFQYADEMQAVSVDEALLEVGSHITEPEQCQEEALATKIRDEIRQATGCEASIGIGSNILLARLSTKKAKPAGQYYCKTKQDIESLLASTSVIDLPGVGYAIQEKLEAMNINTIGDVKKLALHQLQSKLGAKMGQTLFNFSRGIDDRPLLTNQQRQSVSAEVNWGMRFENDQNEKEFVESLSKEVSDRLLKYGVKGKTITVKILKRKEYATQAAKNLGHGEVDSFSKSYTLSEYTSNPEIINKHVYSMLKSFQFSCADIRGLGLTITRLDNVQEVVSPDQGKLKFKARVVPTTDNPSPTNNNEPAANLSGPSSSIQKSMVAAGGREEEGSRTTHSKQRPKHEMTVDYNVYRELPESVQQELMANCNLIFKNRDKGKGNGKGKGKGKGKQEQEQAVEEVVEEPSLTSINSQDMNENSNISIPELPPWSQLDPASLLALPEKMRAQVLEAYGGTTSSKKAALTPPRTHQQQTAAKRKTPSSSSGNSSGGGGANNKRARTITQLFHQQHVEQQSPTMTKSGYKPPLQLEEGLPYDVNVWNELPSDVRTELLTEHRRNKQKELLKEQQRQQQIEAANNAKQDDTTVTNMDEINAKLSCLQQEPSLQGYTEINDIRNLLHEWVNSYRDKPPEAEDVETISNFLVQLVKTSDLEKTQLIVVYLDYLIQQAKCQEVWKEYSLSIQEKVSDVVISLYGYPLKF